MTVQAFGIEKEFLGALLVEGEEGTAQLPEFQRGWVWPVENIRSLLASISCGYPVGTLMMLRTGGAVKFKQRPIEGASPTKKAERLILDGQQRITSLFQALKLGRPIQTQDGRKRKLSGWFYVDMVAALDPQIDREEAIRFVPADRVVRNFRGEPDLDLSTPEREYAGRFFPLSAVFDPDDWFDSYGEHWDYDREEMKRRKDFNKAFVKQFEQYQVPVIELDSSTPREAVCQVFEKVNTGGVTLTVFELLTATFAADEFDLRQDWEERRAQWAAPEYKVLREVANTDLLQTVTLLATHEARRRALAAGADEEKAPRVGCRRVDILALTLDQWQKWAPVAVRGFKTAAKHLHQQHVFDTKFLPYGSQLIPLAAIFALLDKNADSVLAAQRIGQWWWCGIFGELYGGTTETRFARDVPEVVAWARGGDAVPRTVEESRFSPGRLDTLRTRGSAAYKGLYALILKSGAVDWRSGEPMTVTTYFDEYVDIHHIFPKVWCEKQGITPAVFNSIVNKTPLTAATNRAIGGAAPSAYVNRLARSAGVAQPVIEQAISSHAVLGQALLKDDFSAFMRARKEALLELVSRATGKPIDRSSDQRDDTTEADGSDDDLEDQ